jgi:hypothetical protein
MSVFPKQNLTDRRISMLFGIQQPTMASQAVIVLKNSVFWDIHVTPCGLLKLNRLLGGLKSKPSKQASGRFRRQTKGYKWVSELKLRLLPVSCWVLQPSTLYLRRNRFNIIWMRSYIQVYQPTTTVYHKSPYTCATQDFLTKPLVQLHTRSSIYWRYTYAIALDN